MLNTPMLLWKIDRPGSLATEVANAINRFGQRVELSGQTPTTIFFRPGQAPADDQIGGLRVDTHKTIPPGHIAIAGDQPASQTQQLKLF